MSQQHPPRTDVDDVAEAERDLVRERLASPRPTWLRLRSRRRVLVALTLAGAAMLLVTPLLNLPEGLVVPWAVAAGVLWSVAGIPLERALRNVADLPESVLDERIVRERDRVYRRSYRLLGLLALLPVLRVMGLASGEPATVTFTQAMLVGFGLVAAFAALPTALLAWSEADWDDAADGEEPVQAVTPSRPGRSQTLRAVLHTTAWLAPLSGGLFFGLQLLQNLDVLPASV